MADYKDFDPKQAEENRKKEMDEIMGKLESGVASVTNSEEYRKLMDTIAKFPRYSINNNILIMLQRPDATLCQSFTGWKEMNRFVKKGEKGIRILAPAPYKIEKEQDKIGQDGKPVLDQDGEPVKETVQINVNAFKIMEPHIVKIDRSLLSGIDHDADKQANCKDIIEAIHSLNKMVVAEGVETKEEFDYLVSIGADLFQGYYLGRPE